MLVRDILGAVMRIFNNESGMRWGPDLSRLEMRTRSLRLVLAGTEMPCVRILAGREMAWRGTARGFSLRIHGIIGQSFLREIILLAAAGITRPNLPNYVVRRPRYLQVTPMCLAS